MFLGVDHNWTLSPFHFEKFQIHLEKRNEYIIQLVIEIFQTPLDFRNGDRMFLITKYPHGPLVIKNIWSPSKDIWQPLVASTWECCWMVIKFFQSQNSLGAPTFGGTPNLTYIKSFAFSFFFIFFSMCMTLVVLNN
jgi:hypothetical protein